jgi:DHA1 family bicyclomycin/chloramphenicol resistance-like MFS transporter
MTETKLRTGLILLIGALGVLQPFSLDPYLANISFIAKDLNVAQTLIAQNLTALTLGISLGTVVAGPMSDAIGRRRPILFALVGYIGAAILASSANTVEVFFAGRILQGFFAAAAAVIANAMLRDMYEGMLLIKAVGRSMLLMATSWFIGPIFGSYLQSFTNWRGLGYILATLAATLLVIIFIKLPDTMTRDQRTKTTAREVASRFLYLLKDRVFLGLIFVQSCISVSLFCYLSVSPFVYGTTYGINPAQVGIFLSINSVGAYLGSQLGTKLSQKIKPQWALLIALAIGVIAGAILIFTATMNLGFIFFTSALALFTLGFGTSVTPLLGLAMASHPNEAGTAAAVIAVSGTVATTIAGAYYAILDHTSAIGIGFTQFGFMTLGIIILFTVVRPNKLEVMK